MPVASLAIAVLVLYLAVVRRQRYRLRDQHEASPKPLSLQDAHRICRNIHIIEMPWLMNKALSFALFATYGIPTIADVLAKSGQLGKAENTGRRYVDTQLMVIMMLDAGVDSELHSTATARVNWLHSRWPRITNDDMLFTLSLFVLEPGRFARRYGYRALTETEEQAIFLVWRENGHRMGIKDIPETRHELEKWANDYMHSHVQPTENTIAVANASTALFLQAIPRSLHRFARPAVASLIEDPALRKAVGFESPHWLVEMSVKRALTFFYGTITRVLLLPRKHEKRYYPRDIKPNERTHTLHSDFDPIYAAEPTGIGRILVTLGLQQPPIRSDGFVVHELGPEGVRYSGHDKVKAEATRLRSCPIAFGKA